jgi:hypothetical protein
MKKIRWSLLIILPGECKSKHCGSSRTDIRNAGGKRVALAAALLVLALSAAPLFAQDKMSGAEVYGGYQFARFSDGIAVKDLNGNGWDAGFAYYFSRWLGAKADFSGSYATDDTSSGNPFRVTNYTYTFGPVVSPRNRGRFAPFGQFLFGGYHETLAGYPNSDSGFAMLAGGGLDVHLRPNLSLRAAEVDWLYTRPPNSATLIKTNNLRIVTGVVFRF